MNFILLILTYKNIYYIYNQYVPSLNEHVIGKILAKTQDYFRVDIGSAHSALLSTLAFEGATKRNKPNLEVRFN